MNSINSNPVKSKNLSLFIFFILTINFLIILNVFPQVTEQWVARYNGPANLDDCPNAIAIDTSGNVYVTGVSIGSGTSYDYVTIKYNSSGIQQWLARYNGPANLDDWAGAIVIDSLGNVYVTGGSVGSVTNYDYATIKYNSEGIEQWVSRYNGTGNGVDVARAIVIDLSGNVYVTGESIGSGFNSYDYATIKYNNSGVQQWVARYNVENYWYERALAIALDSSRNVYVTGVSRGTKYDYATIKYNSSGAQQWVARYNGTGNGDDVARAIALDNSGNVYVTGESVGSVTNYDYATIKYNNAGAQQWVARYNGPGNGDDKAVAIAVDTSGNVHITGYSYVSGFYDYVTIKYNTAGEEQWVARYDGPVNSYDYGRAIAIDTSGNVYVTGDSIGFGTGADYATIKYNSAGIEQWVVRYDGPTKEDDKAVAIAIDASGNIYVTGNSYGSGTERDYATIKYSQSTFSESFYLY